MELQSVTRFIQVLRQLGRTDGHETLGCAELALIMLVAEASHRVQIVEVWVVVMVDTV
jgi:hypothetical protein